MSATVQQSVPQAPAGGSQSRTFVERILRVRELALLVVLAVLIIGTELGNHRFLSQQGIKDLMLNAAILVIVAIGEATVVVTRNVDLSVGSTLGIAAFAAGDFLNGGGNQQKVVLAKWLATEPKVLIVDEPTRGIDVGTKAEVHRLLSELAGRGLAVLMISSDLPEVIGMADRVLVMHEGRLVAEIPRAEATEETVMSAATGQVKV